MPMPTYGWLGAWKCSQAYCQQDLSAFLTTNFVITPKIVIYCTAESITETITRMVCQHHYSKSCQHVLPGFSSDVDTHANSLKVLYSPSTRDRDTSWLSVTLLQTKLKKDVKIDSIIRLIDQCTIQRVEDHRAQAAGAARKNFQRKWITVTTKTIIVTTMNDNEKSLENYSSLLITDSSLLLAIG